MREVFDRTTEQRARTCPCGDESERCSASAQPDPLRSSCPCMPLSTTRSTSAAISSDPKRGASSVPNPLVHGVQRRASLPEPPFSPSLIATRPNNVTKPLEDRQRTPQQPHRRAPAL